MAASPRPFPRRAALGLGLAAAFLLLFLTRAQEQYGDSLHYLESARSGTGLFHPHHLGYNLAVRAFFLGLRGLLAGLDIVTAAQVHNILWALVSLGCLGFLTFRLTGSRSTAGLASAALLACQGFWEYATQAQIYVPAMGVLALASCVAAGRPDRRWTSLRTTALAGLFILAVLFHQTAVLFILPLGLLFSFGADSGSKKRLVAAGLAAAAILAGLYIGAYLAAGGASSGDGFLRFVLQYTYHPAPNWGTWSNVSPTGAGYLLFSSLRTIGPVFRTVRIPLLAVYGIFLAGLFLWHLLRIRAGRDERNSRRAFLLSWLGVHLAFYLWWAPHDKNNFIIPLFPLILLTAWAGNDLAARLSRPGRRSAGLLTAAALAGLAALNFTSHIRPLHLSRGADFAEASRLAACTAAADAILASNDVRANLIFYFRRPVLLQAEIPPMCFGRGLPLPSDYRALAGRPLVVSPLYLDPRSRLSLVSGYDAPGGWRELLSWLFELEKDAGGEVVSGRVGETLDCGGIYLRVRTERSSLTGWEDFLARLDGLLGSVLGSPRVFRDWAEGAGIRGRPERPAKP